MSILFHPSYIFFLCRRCICWRISFTVGSGEAHWRMCERWLLCSKRYHPKIWLHLPSEAWFSLSDFSRFCCLYGLFKHLLYCGSCLTAFSFFIPTGVNEEKLHWKVTELNCYIVVLFLPSLLPSLFFVRHWTMLLSLGREYAKLAISSGSIRSSNFTKIVIFFFLKFYLDYEKNSKTLLLALAKFSKTRFSGFHF